MKISILLPLKENFSPEYPGAVSIFINDTLKHSKFKTSTTVFGSTEYKKNLIISILILNLKIIYFKVRIKNMLKNLKNMKEKVNQI